MLISFFRPIKSTRKMGVIDVDEWFEIRDLWNEIAHDYEGKDEVAINLLNSIDRLRSELSRVLGDIQLMVK